MGKGATGPRTSFPIADMDHPRAQTCGLSNAQRVPEEAGLLNPKSFVFFVPTGLESGGRANLPPTRAAPGISRTSSRARLRLSVTAGTAARHRARIHGPGAHAVLPSRAGCDGPRGARTASDTTNAARKESSAPSPVEALLLSRLLLSDKAHAASQE